MATAKGKIVAISVFAAVALSVCGVSAAQLEPVQPGNERIFFSVPEFSKIKSRHGKIERKTYRTAYAFFKGDGTRAEFFLHEAKEETVFNFDVSVESVVDRFNYNKTRKKEWGSADAVDTLLGKFIVKNYRLPEKNQECFGFSVESSFGTYDLYTRPTELLLGYYCAREGDPLPSTKINSLIKNITVAPFSEVPPTSTAKVGTDEPKLALSAKALWAYEYYQTDPKFSEFKAFAVDPSSGGWGRSWGYSTSERAIDQALQECSKRNEECEIYAIGKIVVADMSPEEIEDAIEAYGHPDEVPSTSTAKVGTDEPKLTLRAGAQKGYEKYYQSSADFKAFAVDPGSSRWGRSWISQTPKQAIDEAVNWCKKTGQDCTLYALGDTNVLGMSPDQVAAVAEEYYAAVSPDMAQAKSGSFIGKRLSSEEITFYLSDMSVEGANFNRLWYKGVWLSNGTMSANATLPGNIEITGADSGTWTVSDNKLCRQWRHWLGGRRECLVVTKDGQTIRAYDAHGDAIEILTLLEKL